MGGRDTSVAVGRRPRCNSPGLGWPNVGDGPHTFGIMRWVDDAMAVRCSAWVGLIWSTWMAVRSSCGLEVVRGSGPVGSVSAVDKDVVSASSVGARDGPADLFRCCVEFAE